MLSFFPLDVLDEIWDLIESVSEGFLTYSIMYDDPNGSLFISILLHNSEFRFPKFALRISEFGIVKYI